MSAAELQAFLRSEIPLADAMEVVVATASEAETVLTAPLRALHNHHGTAFGGGVSALGMLAGWTRVQARLATLDVDASTVIHHSEIRFDAPLAGDLEARVLDPGTEAWDRFGHMLEKAGKGRISLDILVSDGDEGAALFTGSFVAIAR